MLATSRTRAKPKARAKNPIWVSRVRGRIQIFELPFRQDMLLSMLESGVRNSAGPWTRHLDDRCSILPGRPNTCLTFPPQLAQESGRYKVKVSLPSSCFPHSHSSTEHNFICYYKLQTSEETKINVTFIH